MGIGWPQLLIIALVVLVLFGRGRIAEMMGDFGKGISSFKKGMTEEEAEKPASKAQIEAPAQDAAAAPVATPDPAPAPSAAADKKAAETTDGSN